SNESGHWESVSAISLNDIILQSAGSSWKSVFGMHPSWFRSVRARQYTEQVRDLIKSKFDHSSFFAIKDPRLSLLFPIWHDALEQLDVNVKVVFVFRHPLEVATSLARRE